MKIYQLITIIYEKSIIDYSKLAYLFVFFFGCLKSIELPSLSEMSGVLEFLGEDTLHS